MWPPEPAGGWLQDGERLAPGPHCLREFVSVLYQRLTGAEKRRLSRFFRTVGEQSIVSVCSGTDSPVLCQSSISEAARLDETIDFARVFKHACSCDIVEYKRRFIHEMYGAAYIFFDIADMLQDNLKNWVTQALCKFPLLNEYTILYGGFPCTDVSFLNMYSRTGENMSSCANGTLRTGNVFQMIVKLCVLRSIDVIVLENVTALCAQDRERNPSNYDSVRKALRQAGYVVRSFVLHPWMFGSPQSRGRVWICAVRGRLLARLAGVSMNRPNVDTVGRIWQEALSRYISRFVGHPLMCLRKHFASHSWQLKGDLLNPAKRDSPAVSSSGSGMKWVNGHIHMFDIRGKAWWTESEYSHSRDVFEGFNTLTFREFDSMEIRRDSCGVANSVVDVSQSLVRCTPGGENKDVGGLAGDICPCITPNGRFWSIPDRRLLSGLETLRVQGITFPEQREKEMLLSFSQNQVQDLAGNAFSAFVCAAVTVALEMALSDVLGQSDSPSDEGIAGGDDAAERSDEGIAEEDCSGRGAAVSGDAVEMEPPIKTRRLSSGLVGFQNLFGHWDWGESV